MTTTLLKEWLWDTDIQSMLHDLVTKNRIANEDYWRSTVDLVEAGRSPIRQGQTLTWSDLNEWVERVTTLPQQESLISHAHPTRRIRPAGEPLHDKAA